MEKITTTDEDDKSKEGRNEKDNELFDSVIEQLLKEEERLASSVERIIQDSKKEIEPLRMALKEIQTTILATQKGIRPDQKLLGKRDQLMEKIKTIILRTDHKVGIIQSDLDEVVEKFTAEMENRKLKK